MHKGFHAHGGPPMTGWLMGHAKNKIMINMGIPWIGHLHLLDFMGCLMIFTVYDIWYCSILCIQWLMGHCMYNIPIGLFQVNYFFVPCRASIMWGVYRGACFILGRPLYTNIPDMYIWDWMVVNNGVPSTYHTYRIM